MDTDVPTSVLPGLVGFGHALRRAGLAADPHRTAAFLRAADQLDLADPANLYWAGRLTLCAQPDDLPGYDAAFAAWFTNTPVAPARHGRPNLRGLPTAASALPGRAGPDTQRPVGALAVLAPSDVEVLRHKDIAQLSAAERVHLRQLIGLLRIRPPRRPGLRPRPARTGQLDRRHTLRELLANGGEPVRLRHQRRADRPRRVVLLLDISGSMRPYADALLRFAHVVAGRGNTEVFTLGTRLTRISRQLRLRDPEQALAAAGKALPDYAGGTRLGEGLATFLNRWGRRGIARQATVVLCSDGWERGDPARLAEQLARLTRLAHAVLWVNPHAGKDGYRPVQSGIAAALPHIDRLIAGHSLAALETVLMEIRDA